MNDDLTKDAKAEPKKRWQKIVSLAGVIAVFVFTSYSLFEAYWTEDVLSCGKTVGCHWNSYQDSPGIFYLGVSLNSLLFLFSGFVLIDSVRRKMAGK